MRSDSGPALDTATVRKLAVMAEADPRSVEKELREPGSVRGLAGHRIRRVLLAEGISDLAGIQRLDTAREGTIE